MATPKIAFSKKPVAAPNFDATSFTTLLTQGRPISPALAAQFVNWKRWAESTNQFAGADAGGLKDVLKADAYGMDALKNGQDAHSQQILDLQAAVQALQEAPPARPFP